MTLEDIMVCALLKCVVYPSTGQNGCAASENHEFMSVIDGFIERNVARIRDSQRVVQLF